MTSNINTTSTSTSTASTPNFATYTRAQRLAALEALKSGQPVVAASVAAIVTQAAQTQVAPVAPVSNGRPIQMPGRGNNIKTVIGNVSQKARLFKTTSGRENYKFSVAVRQRGFDADGNDIEMRSTDRELDLTYVDFYNVTVWNNGEKNATLFNNVDLLEVGMQVSVTGAYEVRSYDSRNNPGTRMISKDVTATVVELVLTNYEDGENQPFAYTLANPATVELLEKDASARFTRKMNRPIYTSQAERDQALEMTGPVGSSYSPMSRVENVNIEKDAF